MWLSGQHKRPADCGEGQTGIVTVGGEETAVMLDSERRGLEVYAPAGYHWTPEVDQRVLVIRGPGEIPCIVGVRQNSERPENVEISAKTMDVSGWEVSVQAEESIKISAKTMTMSGQTVSVQAGKSADISANAMTVSGQAVSVQAEESAVVAGKSVDLQGAVLINGEPLEVLIARIVAILLGG